VSEPRVTPPVPISTLVQNFLTGLIHHFHINLRTSFKLQITDVYDLKALKERLHLQFHSMHPTLFPILLFKGDWRIHYQTQPNRLSRIGEMPLIHYRYFLQTPAKRHIHIQKNHVGSREMMPISCCKHPLRENTGVPNRYTHFL